MASRCLQEVNLGYPQAEHRFVNCYYVYIYGKP